MLAAPLLLMMTIREIAIDKLQKLPDSLLRQVNDFIDFVAYRHQAHTDVEAHQDSLDEQWARWFEAVDHLPITSTKPDGDYQQHLISKYRKQGLEL